MAVNDSLPHSLSSVNEKRDVVYKNKQLIARTSMSSALLFAVVAMFLVHLFFSPLLFSSSRRKNVRAWFARAARRHVRFESTLCAAVAPPRLPPTDQTSSGSGAPRAVRRVLAGVTTRRPWVLGCGCNVRRAC